MRHFEQYNILTNIDGDWAEKLEALINPKNIHRLRRYTDPNELGTLNAVISIQRNFVKSESA